MKKYFIFFIFAFTCIFEQAFAKIYDCMIFFNELDILDIRLNELYDYVDKFVIVECVETHQGNEKPLYFLENSERYKKFSDKIIHIVVDDRIDTPKTKFREEYHRNQIMRGLTDCQADDLIMVSDVDEIIKNTKIPEIYNAIYVESHNVLACEQILYRFFFNCHDISCKWRGTCITTFKHLTENLNSLPNELRDKRNKKSSKRILDSGWHFTSMGGREMYALKLESFYHKEQNRPQNKSVEFIQNYINKKCIIVPIDDSYPKYILDNIEYFKNNEFIYEE